jgi:integrase
MEKLKFTTPKTNDNNPEKWLVRYTLHVNGKAEYRKEVGTTYPELGDTLNSKHMRLPSSKNARKNLAATIETLLLTDLNNGVDPENSKHGYQLLNQKKLESLKEWHIQTHLDFYFKKVGLVGEVPDRKKTTQYNLKMFFQNQFIPYFKSKGLANDIRMITKQHVRAYLDYHYEATGKDKWSYRTVNTRRAWMRAFFAVLVEYDFLEINPVQSISAKKADGTGRGDYVIYSEDEIKLMIDATIKKGDKRLELIIKIMYYSFVRGSEMRRITMKHLDLVHNKFRMSADISKKNNSGNSYSVLLHPELVKTIKEWIELKGIDVNNLDYPLFPNPKGKIMCRKFHEKSYHDLLEELRADNKNLFNKKNQTIYSLKSSGVTHTYYKNRDKPDVLKFLQSQCRHASVLTTEIYLKKLDCQIEEQANLSYFL